MNRVHNMCEGLVAACNREVCDAACSRGLCRDNRRIEPHVA